MRQIDLSQKLVDELSNTEILGQNVSALLCSGSIAYGLDDERSDLDIKGFYSQTPESILLGESNGMYIGKTEQFQMFPIQQLIKDGPHTLPDVLELVFFPDDYYIIRSLLFDTIKRNRDLLISKDTYHTYIDMVNFHRNNAPVISFKLIDKEQTANQLIEKLNADQRIRSIMAASGGTVDFYKDNNQEVRIDLSVDTISVEKLKELSDIVHKTYNEFLGFGARIVKCELNVNKRAYHAIRLLHDVRVIMDNGDFVPVYDGEIHDLLFKIKQGGFTQDGVLSREYFEIYDEFFQKALESYQRSKLPEGDRKEERYQFLKEINTRVILYGT